VSTRIANRLAALAGLALVALTVAASGLLLVVFVGVAVLAAGLVGARGWGRLERARARLLLGVRVPDRGHQPADPGGAAVPPFAGRVGRTEKFVQPGHRWTAVTVLVV
jgi:hypothetical protein